jgi:hypothetical protein
MTLFDLVYHLTSLKFSEEAKSTLHSISWYLSGLIDTIEYYDERRKLCLITLIGKEVVLSSREVVSVRGNN